MTDTPTLKGTILKSLHSFIERDLGPESYSSYRERLDPHDRKLVEGRILSSVRVPEATLNRMTKLAAEIKGESVHSFGARAGRAELEESVKVYRFLFAVMTPSGLLSRTSTLWRTVHDHGKLEVVDSSDKFARVRLSEFPADEAHCARLGGWIEGLSEMTRVKDPVMRHDRCETRGDDACEWVVEWK